MWTTVLVLAGGSSRRFGSDKLAVSDAGPSLLDTLLLALPDTAEPVLIGPPRPTRRRTEQVREQPPGGGPVPAIVTGLRYAIQARPNSPIVLLPGDAPGSAAAVAPLLAALRTCPVAVGVDADGRMQPLHAGFTVPGAAALLESAAQGGIRSARALLALANPVPVLLPPRAVFDIDTPEDLRRWSPGATLGGGGEHPDTEHTGRGRQDP